MIKFLAWVEKKGYEKADFIVSLLSDCDKHIRKILRNQHFNYEWISNGYQLQDEDYYEELPKKIALQIPEDHFVIGYAGSLGKANAMSYIIEAVKELKNKKIALCLLGAGDEKNNLIELAESYENIVFFDKVPKNQVNSFLEKCDLLYFSAKNLSIYEYGISANKSFDYMFAEKPVLLTAPEHKSIVGLSECGKIIETSNVEQLKKAILYFVDIGENERQKMGKKGKEYLLNNFTYELLADKYIKVFNELDKNN